MKRTFCGKTFEEMDTVLNMICEIEDRIEMTSEEEDAFNVAIQCVVQVMNRMNFDKEIEWD